MKCERPNAALFPLQWNILLRNCIWQAALVCDEDSRVGTSRWGTLSCRAMHKPLGPEAPCFSPEWDTKAKKNGATAAGAQWGCQSEKWGVNSGPVGSHMSGMRKQQFED